MKGSVSPNRARLHECEQVIAAGIDTFVSVGNALVEIRDDKLYRDSHRTFEDYCRARWNLGRSRAYELIDQARVVSAIEEAVGECPAVPDISSRDARAIKADLPAVVADIKSRVDDGLEPDAAVRKAIADKRAEQRSAATARVSEAADRAELKAQERREREAKQAENDRLREEHRANLPEGIRQAQAFRNVVRSLGETVGLTLEDENAELRAANESLTAENAQLRAENSAFAEMKAEFEKGGFAEVIAGKDEVIRSQGITIENESREKAGWMRSAKAWRKRAEDLGYSNELMLEVDDTGATGYGA